METNNNNKKDIIYPFNPQFEKSNIFALLIVLAALIAYSNSFTVPFIFDDKPSILQNPYIRTIFPLINAFHHPYSTGIASRPVINLTLALNYAISKENVWSYHIFNLCIHILSTLFLFGIIRRTLLSDRLYYRFGRMATYLAFGCAILWMLHPVQTESVTYIIQRCESLMGLCFLMTVYFAIRGWQSGSSWKWHLAAVLSFYIGVGCKEVIVTAPFILLLYQWVFILKPVVQILKKSLVLYTGLITGLILLGVLVNAGKTLSSGLGHANISISQYAMTQPEIICHYLKLTIWPVNLCLDYAWPAATPVEALPWILIMLVLAVIFITALLRKYPSGFLGAWFFIILTPSSSIIPLPDLAFEHRMYLSLAALITLLVVGGYNAIHIILEKCINLKRNLFSLEKSVGCQLILVFVVVLGILTFARNHDYRSRISIWQDTVNKQPKNARAHMGLASALLYRNRLKESLFHYYEAKKINPDDERVYRGTGLVLVALGRYKEAALNFEKALCLGTYPEEVNNNLGFALERQGLLKEAAMHYKLSLQYDPGYSKAQKNLKRVMKIIKGN